MNLNFLAGLLHIADPTLPIGGYSHSNGLETYVQKRIIHNVKTAKEFVENMLVYNLKYNDGAFMKLTYEAVQKEDLRLILQLDNECNAIKCPREIRQASQKLGLRLIKIFKRRDHFPFIEAYEKAVRNGEANSHYCIVFGMYAAVMKIPLYEALLGFYYTSVAGMITNAVKLVPLGQLDGQDILFSLYPVMEQTVLETIDLDRELVGICNTSFDIHCMQHERLYSRLYMS
ncbi:urease accessory protein UreF [Chryseobacterium piperi]|uniref:Urease accessory protein UreF n=1 Tax=Chryseobacterium piperi TaxID=558152 RepID=A0A086BI93_9FLAO|nr:urease accessory protein UreF [Chryseobacterium piperi]ASW76322.1 urease accessory protein UreF [Chryseobacterium piperi]KFF28657.1 urease accessory protein UreF [Chryseobacterium piperi]